MEAEVKVTLLVGCARCYGTGHSNLTFQRLQHPVEHPEGDLTHWAMCPTVGEPILMRFEGEYGSLRTQGG